MRLRSTIISAMISCLLTWAVAARAADDNAIINMQHSTWTAAQGAPSGVTSVVQTPDGWLWIGSSVGLFRFDGVRFQRAEGDMAPLSSNITNLGLLPDGRVWITYKYGGVSLMAPGRMEHFRVGEHNMPGGTADGLAQDADGRLWLASPGGLELFDADGNWRKPPPGMGAPDQEIISMLLDRAGIFWVRTNEAVYALPKHAAQFERRLTTSGYGKLAQDPDGAVWTSDMTDSGLHLVHGVPGTNPQRWKSDSLISYFMFDAAGSLWVPATEGVDLVMATSPKRTQHSGSEQGLSGSGYVAFQDRERNVWIGTENGLDRFRAYRLAPLTLPPYIAGARPLAPRGEGGAWVDSSSVASADAAPVPYTPPTHSVADLTTALYAAPDGTLWSGGTGGLSTFRDGKRTMLPLPQGAAGVVHGPIFSIAGDGTGTLWISFGRRGVYTLRDGVWTENGGVAGLAGLFPLVISIDAHRRVWFGATDDRLFVLDQGRLRRYGRADGLHIGTVQAILPTTDGAWIGGENGIAYADGRSVTPVIGRGDDPFAGATGLVFAQDGALWINGGAGISAISAAEQGQAISEPGHRVHFDRLDYRDGLRGTASAITPFPSAIRSSDHVLWFSTMAEVYAFDPAKLARNSLVPPVYITAVRANGREYPPGEEVRLPPRTNDLTLDFAALSLRAPERMNFRYRLEGSDPAWQELAGRRSVNYTNLGPGHYRFRVTASNDDGVWNEEGAVLSFDIEPAVTQTLWFRALCALAAVLLLWLAHRWRLLQLSARMRLRLDERVGERTRIARALHDTILQSMQGILLHMQAARSELPEGDVVRARLDSIFDEAGRAYAEGRDQVTALRVSPAGDIEGTIAETAERLQADHPGTVFTLQVSGKRARLRDAVAVELAEIAREAIRNAFRHAAAAHIDVTLDYGLDDLALAVRDDGGGIANPASEGHWGLVGMGERAARIRAGFSVDGAGPGTRILVTVAARHAYVDARRWRWSA